MLLLNYGGGFKINTDEYESIKMYEFIYKDINSQIHIYPDRQKLFEITRLLG